MRPLDKPAAIPSFAVLYFVIMAMNTLFFAGCNQLEMPANENFTADKSYSVIQGDGAPIRALYLTDYSNFWHKYERQQKTLREGIGQYVNIEFSMVGKNPNDTLAMMKTPNFSRGYDVIIYNMCFADDMDTQRIDNVISQTRDLGVPAVLLHCAMHSFRGTSQSGRIGRKLRAAEKDWSRTNPGEAFPYWWRFTGIDTTSHDWARAMQAVKVEGDHPITSWLPQYIETGKDELYRNLEIAEGVVPLYTAYSPESRRHHVVAWTHEVGEGRVFGTTLGHGSQTTELGSFHQLIAHGIAYVTGHLDEGGAPKPGYEGTTSVDNYQATVTCQPSDVIEAINIGDVQEAVRRAASEDKSLKVVSLKRSNSNNGFICPDQGGILLNLWRMKDVVSLDAQNLTVTVQPGIRADQLSEYLHREGYAIRAMPDYTGVSIAGGIATAAHHSSLNIPSSMADMVEGLKIVDAQGDVRFFTGEDTAAVAAHLGMLGVVVEVTLTIEPQFKLQYGHDAGRDEALEDEIERMVRGHDYARVMWFVGNGRYVFDYYDRVPSDTPGGSEHNLWSSSGGAFRWLGGIPYEVLNRGPLRAQCDSALLRSTVWVPPFKNKDAECESPTGWSHEMLGSNCEPGSCPWDNSAVRSRTIESSFPLRRLREWMTDVRAIIAENRACFPVLGIYLRFSKASDTWMGFNYGEDTVAFEIHVPKVANETYLEKSSAVYDEILQMTLFKYNGRPHWGKNSSPAFVGVGPSQYPKWNSFLRLKDDMDPAGLFNNRIWREMNGESVIKPYPGCVLSRDCICADDSHCGDGFACVPGGYFSPARVCR